MSKIAYKKHKAGFVSILGNPNVGKSTLMNAMLGEKLSIVTHKAQTTRKTIKGILNGDNFQIVFCDTPGIIKARYGLEKRMMGQIRTSFEDSDILLYVCDFYKGNKNFYLINKIKESNLKKALIINKIDLAKSQQDVIEFIEEWKEIFPNTEIIPISAKKRFNLEKVKDFLIKNLPFHPPYFDKTMISDQAEKFFISEIIREKIYLYYKEEIPYSCEVEIELFEEKENIVNIFAIIYVIRDSQKGILIGYKGNKLKGTAIAARKEIEEFLNKKVFLKILVKVKKEWLNNERDLNSFGY